MPQEPPQDPARLKAVEAIFHAALDVAPGRLDAFLDASCGGNASLRLDVETLLAAHRRAPGFIDASIATLDTRRLEDEEPDRLVGEIIGHWEVLRRIGTGGMGAVYLARRADRQYEQQVALKLIKRGMDTEAVLRRFRNERQILAGFDHPNIARLLDGDTTDDGLPYFVMEYVEGLPIDEYCDRHELSVDDRLRLFRKACAAVSYAHRRAVIHRDLKPTNILVDANGVPKLLDFGIARLLQPAGSADAPATLLEQRAMTPEYASPEHARGEAVTTASDVYSLGVILYRLLTGQSPHRGDIRDEADRAPGQSRAPAPSTVVDAATGKRMRGDLDNIVLMALREEPERRYGSVEEFSEDIRRHLDALPVRASRDTLAYRATKFVRRNAAASIAAALVVASLVGGIVMATWQAQRAREQEAIALAQKARAEHRFNEIRQLARSVIFDYHDAIKDLSGATAIRERLVKDGLAYLDSLAGEAGGDPDLQRELAAAYDRVGDVRGENYSTASLGDAAGAIDSYMRALRIREGLAAASPADLQNRRELAGSYRKIGMQLASTLESARGEEFLRKGVAVLEGIAAERPADIEVRQDLAATYNALGLALEGSGDVAGTLSSHRKALALREELVAADPANPKPRRSVIISEINLGRALVLSGDIDGGIASNRKALARCEELLAKYPDSADYRRLLGNTYQNDGDYRAIRRDFDGAAKSFRTKLKFDERSLAEDPDNAVARFDLAYSHLRLGFLLGETGWNADALVHYRSALAQYDGMNAESSEDLYLRFRALSARAGIAQMQAASGDRAGALAHASRVLVLLDDIPEDPLSAGRSSLRGQVYRQLAVTHATLGGIGQLGLEERRKHWRTARELYLRSSAIWEDMQRRGILTAEDATQPQEVAAGINLCDDSLRRLAG